MSILLALLLQVGPNPGGPRPISPLPPELQERRAPPAAPPNSDRLDTCLAEASANPLTAIDFAEAWRDAPGVAQAAQANRCLGAALSTLGRWDEAEAALLAARDASAVDDHAARARLGAMAGNAALATSSAERALAAFDTALGAARAAGDSALAGAIQLDRARALVARDDESAAATALDEARAAAPDSAEAWLLSATLSRRTGKLAEAQARIERAAQLLPVDPEIGLEAGVIAALSGRDEAARRSWQSVIAAAPDSPAAASARTYLAQLGAP